MQDNVSWKLFSSSFCLMNVFGFWFLLPCLYTFRAIHVHAHDQLPKLSSYDNPLSCKNKTTSSRPSNYSYASSPFFAGKKSEFSFIIHSITYTLMAVVFASRWCAQTQQLNHCPVLSLTYPCSQDFNTALQVILTTTLRCNLVYRVYC